MTLGLILLYIVMVILRPQEYVQGMEDAPILSSLFVATFLAWLVSVKKDYSVPQPALITFFIFVALISVEASGNLGGSWVAFNDLMPGWGIFMMLSMTAVTLKQIRLVLDVITVCAFVIALHSIDQYMTGYGWTGLPIRPFDQRVHYLGIFNDPNDLGTLLVSTIPIVIYWLGRESSGFLKLVYLIIMAGLISAIYMTDSRGVLLAGGLIVLMEIGKRYGAIKAGALGGALGVLAVGYTRLSELDVDEASAAGRIEAWYQGIEMFKANPLLGVGFSNFTEFHHKTAHNSFVLVMAETGIMGFYFWLAVITMTLIILINFLRKSEDDLGIKSKGPEFDAWQEYRGLTWAYFMMLLGYLASIIFLSRSYDTYFFIVFGVGSGLCLALQKRYKVLPEITFVNRMGGWAITAFSGVLLIYVGVKVLFFMQG